MRILKKPFLILVATALFLTGCCKDESYTNYIKYSQETRYALMQRPKGSYWVYKDFEHNIIDTFTVDNLVHEFTQSKDKRQCGSYMINNFESSTVSISNKNKTVEFDIKLGTNSGEFSFGDYNATGYSNISPHFDGVYTTVDLNNKSYSNAAKIGLDDNIYSIYFKYVVMQPNLGIIAFQDTLNNTFELIDHKF